MVNSQPVVLGQWPRRSDDPGPYYYYFPSYSSGLGSYSGKVGMLLHFHLLSSAGDHGLRITPIVPPEHSFLFTDSRYPVSPSPADRMLLLLLVIMWNNNILN